MSKIIQLSTENVKRVRAVTITPDGNTVVIGGQNEQGKSSVLDSILYALAGEKSHPEKPLRDGAENGFVEVDLGDIIARRTFTPNGTYLTVKRKEDDKKLSSPQAILDALLGRIGFDPMEFSRLKPVEQAEILAGLAGLDFNAYQRDHDTLYNDRHAANRDVDRLKIVLQNTPMPAVTQTESIDVILKEQTEAQTINAENNRRRVFIRSIASDIELTTTRKQQAQTRIDQINEEIARLYAERNEKEHQISACNAALTEKTALLEQNIKELEARPEDVDLAPFANRIKIAEQDAQAKRDALFRVQIEGELAEANIVAGRLHKKLEDHRDDMKQRIAQAVFPIPGLSMDLERRVLFNGLPFAQLSSAERIRISVAVGLALNPKLRVLFIRDGSLLDDKHLAEVAAMATAADAQVWIERVGEGKECSVVIEDGLVKPA